MKDIPDPLRDNLARSASELVKPELLIEHSVLQEKTISELHTKINAKGIYVDAQVVYYAGPYFVLQVQVKEVDFDTFLTEQSIAPRCSGCLKFFLSLFGTYKQTLERHYLPNLVQSELTRVMADIMREDFRTHQVTVDPVVLDETEQARFFFDMLQYLQQRRQNKKLPWEMPNLLDDVSESPFTIHSNNTKGKNVEEKKMN